MALPSNDNGRITLAVIQRDILHLTKLLEAHIGVADRCHNDHENRLREIEDWKPRVEEKQRTSTGLLAAFSVLLTAISAGIGSLFK